jgi:hypothetical protein
MEYASEQEKVLDDEGGWVDTHHFADKDLGEKVSEMNLEDASSSSPGNLVFIFLLLSTHNGNFVTEDKTTK